MLDMYHMRIQNVTLGHHYFFRGSVLIAVPSKQRLTRRVPLKSKWLWLIVQWNTLLEQEVWWEIKVKNNNETAILLETNGIKSSAKWTKYMNVRFVSVKVRILNKNIKLERYLNLDVIGDYFITSLQGKNSSINSENWL